MYAFESESALLSLSNVKEPFAWNSRNIRRLSEQT